MSEAPAGRSQARNFAAFILLTLIWGSTWLVIKDQISAVPVGWTVTWRYAFSSRLAHVTLVTRSLT